MKRIIILATVFLAVFIFTANVFAQGVKIVDIEGDVLLKERVISPWRKAKTGEALHKNYELITKEQSECTLSFDDSLDKVLTLGENSRLKIADVISGNLELAKGRVFSLIEKIEEHETFEIKTPTAIAGPRGTGWSVYFGGITIVYCFEGGVFIDGLDEKGNKVSHKDIKAGSGVKVPKGGKISDLFGLTGKDKKDWKKFKGNLKGKGTGQLPPGAGAQDKLRQIREEQREDFREDMTSELRHRREAASSSSSGGDNGGDERK